MKENLPLEVNALSPFLNLNMKLGNPIQIGNTNNGYFKIIPILGGTCNGEIKGKILSYGGDVNFKYSSTLSKVNASYILKTNDNENIFIKNSGIIDKSFINYTFPHLVASNESIYSYVNNLHLVGKIITSNNNIIKIVFYKFRN